MGGGPLGGRWGGLGNRGGEISVYGEDGEKLLSILSPTSVMTETLGGGVFFQYFTTLVEKADPLLRRWLVPWSPW